MTTTHRHRRQLLETDRLLGVDFVVRPPAGGVTAGSADPASAAATASTPGSAGVDARHGDDDMASSRAERGAALDALRIRHDAECTHCTSATAHTRTVFGEGDPCATIMFIGEAPGETEDQEGRPFVGRAGRKLEEIISAMGLSRERVYIANVLKSRPPGNRAPLAHEADACGAYLREQVRIIRPKVIVSLGGSATKLLLGTDRGITSLRGLWARYDAGDFQVDVMPTLHPAYLLRNYTVETRRQVWSDMQAVLARVGAPA